MKCTLKELEEEEDSDDDDNEEDYEVLSYTKFCEPNWECSSWSKCQDSMMSRECKDTNHCSFSYNKPNEQTSCKSPVISKSLVEKEDNTGWFIISLLISLVLIIILSVLVNKR